MWSQHVDFMNNCKDHTDVIVQEIDVQQKGVVLVPIAEHLCPHWPYEEAAFGKLQGQMTAFPSLVQDSIKRNSVSSRYVRAPHNQVLSKMLVVTEGLVDDIVVENENKRNEENNDLYDDNKEPEAETTPELQAEEVVQQEEIV